MKRHASAVWNGDLREGKGRMSSDSGAFRDLRFSFNTRFGDEAGTNPEELIAAAHAGCFSMAFSNELAKAGMTPEEVATKCTITLEMVGGGFEMTKSLLTTTAKVPGASAAKVEEIAEIAKAGCPVSKVLNVEVTLDLTVEV
ncbi:OsmC family protein [Tropicimonas sp. IMCC34043]|uniref:OsmC family protein n=1 Tax=Tropicimonas sp. IMCC34043 TaxID=2248760 RepID=UPI000E232A46|nr:OsmC family protein [Tropicimonas sp. IMCC34043]